MQSRCASLSEYCIISSTHLFALNALCCILPQNVVQVRVLQTVVKEKDVRFQEQIHKHEQEILSLTQASNDNDLQQVLLSVFGLGRVAFF